MKDFRGKVALVTGAASGIGRALAERFAAEGMKVVLADVEEAALNEVSKKIKATGLNIARVGKHCDPGDHIGNLYHILNNCCQLIPFSCPFRCFRRSFI